METRQLRGLECLVAATALLRRVRRADPRAGLLEAADLQWWWRTPRATDTQPQLFWFDEAGRPEAACIATDWGDAGLSLDPIVMPGASPGWIEQVVDEGLTHLARAGPAAVGVAADPADAHMCRVLADRGFTAQSAAANGPSTGLAVVSAWMAAEARPQISGLPNGYRSFSRVETQPRPHHMVARSGALVEARLRQTSLYRPELDLVVLDGREQVAAYGLFWFDPDTATGLVEPMRTEDAHQRRGLGRHLLTAGLHRLADAGATQVKICFKPGNPAASGLYLSAGFLPDKQTVVFSRPLR